MLSLVLGGGGGGIGWEEQRTLLPRGWGLALDSEWRHLKKWINLERYLVVVVVF